MPYRFSNDLFALKKCSNFLHIKNLISNKINSGNKHLMNAESLHVACVFEIYDIKNWGQRCKFRDIGQDIQI